MPKPLFTIGITTRNRWGLLHQAVESVLAQDFSALEILIVDDGSSVPRSSGIDALLGAEGIRLIEFPAQRGRGPGRQEVVDQAQGEWLLWLDDDDLMLPGFLSALAPKLESADRDIYCFDTIATNPEKGVEVFHRGQDITPEMFWCLGADTTRRLLHGEVPQTQIGSLWSKVARVSLCRSIPFVTDESDPRSQTLEDVDWTARVLKRTEAIPHLRDLHAGYLARTFSAMSRFERSQEADQRLEALALVLDEHKEEIRRCTPDAAYECACRVYQTASGIMGRMERWRDLWRFRAECAVSAGGELMELFLDQVTGQAEYPALRPADSDPFNALARSAMPSAMTGKDVVRLLRDFIPGQRSGARAIGYRRRSSAVDIANPFMFVPEETEPAMPLDLGASSVFSLDLRGQGWTICDVSNERLLHSSVFAYSDQFEAATQVETVPWGQLPGDSAAADNAALLFSIGRCGSTLAGRLIAAAGGQVASVFDGFTQIGQLTGLAATQNETSRARLRDLWNELLAHITLAGGQSAPLAVKMRAQATPALDLIPPDRRGPLLFMVRRLEPWLRSSFSQFPGMSVEQCLENLSNALQAVARARRRGLHVRIIHYEGVVEQPEQLLSLMPSLGIGAKSERVTAALSSPSQSGTSLETSKADPKSHAVSRKCAAFLDQWTEERYGAVTRELGLTLKLERTQEGAE